jgi:hypothetical protein
MSRNCLVVLKLVASKILRAEKAVIKSPDAKSTVMLKWDCKIGPEGNRMLE